MPRTPAERIEDSRQTIEALRRALPVRDAPPEAIAALHEVHARHERAQGRPERAKEAEARAARVRARDARRVSPGG